MTSVSEVASSSLLFFTRWSYPHKLKASEQIGIYLLFSTKADKIYVGQSCRSVKRRIDHHAKAKDWWSFGFFLELTDRDVTRNDLDALEKALILSFRQGVFGGHIKCVNVQKGNASFVLDELSVQQVYDDVCRDLCSFFKSTGGLGYGGVYNGLISIPNDLGDSGCVVTSAGGLFAGYSYRHSLGVYLNERLQYDDVMPFYQYFGEDVFESGFVLSDIKGAQMFDVIQAFNDELLYFE